MNILSSNFQKKALLMAALVTLSSVPTAHAIKVNLSKKTVGVALLFATWMRLYSKESKAVPVNHYDLGKTLELHKIASKDYWQNMGYVIDEGLIGQAAKPQKIAAEINDRIEFKKSNATPATGVCGKVDSLVKSTSRALKGMGELVTIPLLAYAFFYDAKNLHASVNLKEGATFSYTAQRFFYDLFGIGDQYTTKSGKPHHKSQ